MCYHALLPSISYSLDPSIQMVLSSILYKRQIIVLKYFLSFCEGVNGVIEPLEGCLGNHEVCI